MASVESPVFIRYNPGDVTRGTRGVTPGGGTVADALGLQNRGAFAANDPRFAQSPASGGAGIRGFLSRLGARANIAGAVGFLAELIAEDLIRTREEEIQGGFDALAARRRRLGFEKGNMRSVLLRSDDAGRVEPDQIFQRSTSISDLQLPTAATPGQDVLSTTADLEPGSIQVEIPPQTPGIQFEVEPIAEPVAPPVVEPVGDPVPDPVADPLPDPGALPPPSIPPGFGVPSVPGLPTNPLPPPNPIVFSPRTPKRDPVGDLFDLTPRQPGGVPSEGPRSFAPGEVIFPNPQPNPQPAQRRCRPCPREEEPKPRDKCMKGLYREGFLDNDVDFTEWVEIDCITGREL